MEFGARYDRTAKILTGLVCALLLAVPLWAGSAQILFISVLIVGTVFACSPRGYVISGRMIVVKRWIGNARIPLEDLRDARRATPDDLRGCLRLFGSGGMFGYFGLFRTSPLGRCWWYLTNRQNTVVVIAAGQTSLFSPDNIDGFLAAIGPVEAGESPSRPAAGWSRVATAIAIAVGVITVAVVAFALLYTPGPPSLTLTNDSLTIHDWFYPVTVKADEVDVAGIRVVDIAIDTAWRPTSRTNGFANSQYRAGWFKTANGRQVRLYRANGSRLVLLPPKAQGTPVLLEVNEPDKFLEKLREEWEEQP